MAVLWLRETPECHDTEINRTCVLPTRPSFSSWRDRPIIVYYEDLSKKFKVKTMERILSDYRKSALNCMARLHKAGAIHVRTG